MPTTIPKQVEGCGRSGVRALPEVEDTYPASAGTQPTTSAWSGSAYLTHRTSGYIRQLSLDLIGGVFLAVSPWLFGFSERAWAPHLIVGLLEIGVVVMTRTTASEHGPVTGTPAHH